MVRTLFENLKGVIKDHKNSELKTQKLTQLSMIFQRVLKFFQVKNEAKGSFRAQVLYDPL